MSAWFQQKSKLGALGSFGVDVEGVQRLASSHDEAVLLGAAKQRFAQTSGQMNLSDALAVGRKDVHAVNRSDYLAEAKEILS